LRDTPDYITESLTRFASLIEQNLCVLRALAVKEVVAVASCWLPFAERRTKY
jgi:hypothetical protein